MTDYTSIASQTWLKSVKNRIILYDGRSGILYSYASSNSSVTKQAIDIGNEADFSITGFAVTADGTVVTSKKPRNPEHPAGPGGLFYLINVGSVGLAKWMRVSQDPVTPTRLNSSVSLLGADETSIVYHCCPAISRTKSVGWKLRLSRIGSCRSEVPAKWGFSRRG